MGQSSSTPAPAELPFPAAWLPEAAAEAERALAAVRTLASMDPANFLGVRAPLPVLSAETWSAEWGAGLLEYKACASTALMLDAKLNKLVYTCVPRRATEAEFWRCWFSWAFIAIATPAMLPSCSGHERLDSMPSHKVSYISIVAPPDDDEVTRREQAIEDAQEYYEGILGPLRAQRAAAAQAHSIQLADATDRRLTSPRAEKSGVVSASRQQVNASKRALERVEQEYSDAVRDMRDEVAHLRRELRACASAGTEPSAMSVPLACI
jgi:hypothetical protein